MTNGLVTSSSPPNVATVGSMSVSLYQRTVFRNSAPSHLEHDLARGVVVEAIARLASHVRDVDAVQCAAGERGPHPAVDLDRLRACPHERAQRAGGRRDHRASVVRVLERRLVAEAPHRGAYAFEPRLELFRRP